MNSMKNKTLALMVCLVALTTTLYSQDRLAVPFAKSIEYEYKGDYEKAIASLREVYEEKSYEVNVRLGWLCNLAAQYMESADYYKKASELMPYSIEAKMGYVTASAALGNWELVVAQYKKILEIDPQNTVVNYRLGLIDYNNKRYATAYKYFEKVINLYPFGYDALLMFAWTNFQMGKSREAKVLFQKVLYISPTDKSALEGIGLIK